jgi:hypothetical protein
MSIRIEELESEQVELLPERDTLQTALIGNVSIAVAINVAAGNIFEGGLNQNALAAAANVGLSR